MAGDQTEDSRLPLLEQRVSWIESYVERIDGYLRTLVEIEQGRAYDKKAIERAFNEIKALQEGDDKLWTTVNEIYRAVASLQTAEENAWRQHDHSRHASDFGGVNKGAGETGEPEDGPRRFKHWLLYGGGIIVILGGFATAFQMGVKIGGG